MEKAVKVNVGEIVTQFIQKFRIALLSLLALLVIGIIGSIIYEEASKASVASMTVMVEELDAAHEALSAAKDDAEKKTLNENLNLLIGKAIGDFKGTYAAQRALFIKATLLYGDKSYAEAETIFLQSVAALPSSYLAPVASLNAAFAAEDAGNTDKAITYLKEIIGKHEKTSPVYTRALFNLGRINEGKQQWKDAQDSYQKIVDTSPNSNWTKLARDRILYMKAQQKL